MKKIIAILLSVTLASCCAGNNDNPSAADTSSLASTNTTAVDTLCFVHAEGVTGKKDLSELKLIISGDSFTGRLTYIPFEKDRKAGIINGTKQGDYLAGTWHYMQEGIADSVPVAFKLIPNGMLQKTYAYDAKTGVMYLPDTALYSISYMIIDCGKIN